MKKNLEEQRSRKARSGNRKRQQLKLERERVALATARARHKLTRDRATPPGTISVEDEQKKRDGMKLPAVPSCYDDLTVEERDKVTLSVMRIIHLRYFEVVHAAYGCVRMAGFRRFAEVELASLMSIPNRVVDRIRALASEDESDAAQRVVSFIDLWRAHDGTPDKDFSEYELEEFDRMLAGEPVRDRDMNYLSEEESPVWELWHRAVFPRSIDRDFAKMVDLPAALVRYDE